MALASTAAEMERCSFKARQFNAANANHTIILILQRYILLQQIRNNFAYLGTLERC